VEAVTITTSLLVVGVAILAVLAWFTHRDVSVLHRDFVTLTRDMRTDRIAMFERMDKAVASCDRAASACAHAADRVGALVQHLITKGEQPRPVE
jgi:hypothetical protein